jgi:hypothetical protein
MRTLYVSVENMRKCHVQVIGDIAAALLYIYIYIYMKILVRTLIVLGSSSGQLWCKLMYVLLGFVFCTLHSTIRSFDYGC